MSCELKDPLTCNYIASDGIEYEEFSCIYKFLEPLYFEVEKCFNSVSILDWTTDNSWIPIAAVTIYGIAIFWGQHAMKKREPFNYRISMALWNLFLSMYSFISMARVIPHILHNLSVGEPRDLLCISPEKTYGHGSTGMWVTLFMLSKFVELFDTLFIVIHKKPLIFLHYYHHITVLLYSWYAYITRTPSSIIFMAVNCSVHAMMYGYYFLMTIKMKPKWMNPVFITLAQLVQMVVGVIVTIMSTYYLATASEENPCDLDRKSLLPCFAMYGTYFLLFLKFFVNRYYKARSRLASSVQKKVL